MSYGFFLTWLLTFLYDGPILNYAFCSLAINMNYLVAMYIGVPSIACFFFVLIFKEKWNAYLLMKYGLITCFVGTVILMFFNIHMIVTFTYLISGILGTASIVYISGWGKLFVKHMKLIDMFKIMGLTICFGKAIFSLNQILSKFNLDFLAAIIAFLALGLSYYTMIKLKKYEYECSEGTKILAFNSDVLIALCFAIFFVNIGRGLILSFVTANLDTVVSAFFIDLILYVVVFVILLKTNNKYQGQIVMTSALVMLGIGFIILILLDRNNILPYTVTTLAYLILNIHI